MCHLCMHPMEIAKHCSQSYDFTMGVWKTVLIVYSRAVYMWAIVQGQPTLYEHEELHTLSLRHGLMK